MSMTRKDFTILADAIANADDTIDASPNTTDDFVKGAEFMALCIFRALIDNYPNLDSLKFSTTAHLGGPWTVAL